MVIMKKFVHKLRRVSTHSYAITIPKEMVDKFGWRERQKIEIVEKGRKRLELKDWRSR